MTQNYGLKINFKYLLKVLLKQIYILFIRHFYLLPLLLLQSKTQPILFLLSFRLSPFTI